MVMTIDRDAAAWSVPVALAAGMLGFILTCSTLVGLVPLSFISTTSGDFGGLGAALVSAVAPACVVLALLVLARTAWRWRSTRFLSRSTARGFDHISGFFIQAGIFSAFIAPNLIAWLVGGRTPVVDLDHFSLWIVLLGVLAATTAWVVRRASKGRDEIGAPSAQA